MRGDRSAIVSRARLDAVSLTLYWLIVIAGKTDMWQISLYHPAHSRGGDPNG
jgi:hypothetical protein